MPRSKPVKAGDSARRKKVVRDFFQLVMQGRQKESLRFFAPSCRQHNPYVLGGMAALFDSMAAVQKESKYTEPYFAIKNILAEGDLVAAHTVLLGNRSKPSEGGLRQIHLFRFDKRNRIVEYWDISQMVLPDMPNAAGAL
jgi:predicted SnoaL-like aldol condensation-catalyzing enzyme